MPPPRTQKSRRRQPTAQSPPKSSASYSSHSTRPSTQAARYGTHQSPIQPKQVNASLADVDEESDLEDELEVQPVTVPSDADALDSTGDRDLSDDDISDASLDEATQLEALDTDLIVDTMSTLHYACTQILAFVSSRRPTDLVEALGDLKSRDFKRLQNLVNQSLLSRQIYGSNSYVDVPLILRKLTSGRDVNEGLWRPDAVLQHANLSILVAELTRQEDTAIYDVLERMFHTFPEPFGQLQVVPGHTKHRTTLLGETIDMGIDLRTQFFLRAIERKRKQEAFDPDSILKKVFFSDEDVISAFQAEGEDALPEAEHAVLERMNSIRKFFRSSSKHPVDFNKLKQAYPWQSFILKALKWISLREQELCNVISMQGGVEAIQKRLENNHFEQHHDESLQVRTTPELIDVRIEKRQDQGRRNQSYTSTESETPPQLKTSTMSRDAAVLKGFMAQEDDTSTEDSESDDQERPQTSTQVRSPLKVLPNRAQSRAPEIPQSPDAAVADDDDNDDITSHTADISAVNKVVQQDPLRDAQRPQTSPAPSQHDEIIPTQQTLAVLEVARQQALLGNKENIDNTRRSYLDRQANAKQLDWDDSQHTQLQAGQKRVQSETEVDGEDDSDEFETDSRPTKRPRHVRPPPPGAVGEWIGANIDDEHDNIEKAASHQLQVESSRSASRPRLSTQPPPRRSRTSETNRKEHSQPPSSSAPETRQPHRPHVSTPSASVPTAEKTTVRDYITINMQAKESVRQHVVDPERERFRARQARRGWDPEEIGRLMDMMAVYGCQWARILEGDAEHPQGPRLQRRGQVQLKDKARNMKMDYLKAGQNLPVGFHKVTIKGSDKALLARLGLHAENGDDSDHDG